MMTKQIKLMTWLLVVLICAVVLIIFLFYRNTNMSDNRDKSASETYHCSLGTESTEGMQTTEAILNSMPELTPDEVINLVEQSNPYELKPTMTAEQRYELRSEIYDGIEDDKVANVSYAIQSCATQLSIVVADDRYQELIDRSNEQWDIYDANDLYGVFNMLEKNISYISYEPLIEDLQTAARLADEGLEERNVLKIIDANRILQDLSRHLLRVPYQGADDLSVDYGNLHEVYFKVTITLEGEKILISE